MICFMFVPIWNGFLRRRLHENRPFHDAYLLWSAYRINADLLAFTGGIRPKGLRLGFIASGIWGVKFSLYRSRRWKAIHNLLVTHGEHLLRSFFVYILRMRPSAWIKLHFFFSNLIKRHSQLINSIQSKTKTDQDILIVNLKPFCV